MMKTRIINKFILVLINLIAIPGLYSQEPQKELINKWVCYKKILKNGETGENVTFNRKPFTPNMTLNFINKNNVIVVEGEVKVKTKIKYQIANDTLNIGIRSYIIEELDDTKLILLELDNINPLNNLVYRRYFKLE